MSSVETTDSPVQTMNENNLIFPVDAEHGGLRLAVFTLFIFGAIFIYIFISTILPSDSINLIALLGSLGITALAVNFAEKWLKANWKSGRVLEVSDQKISIRNKSKVEREIDPTKQVNVLFSKFTVKSGRHRIKKGWFMVSCSLEQDNTFIPIYTFVSPEQYTDIPLSDRFVRLMSKKEQNAEGNDRDMRLAGQQRRLHHAEQERWNNGAEVTVEQFNQFLKSLQARFPKWMPTDT